MKTMIFVLFLSLTSCQISLPLSDDEIGKFFPPTMEAFEFSNRCSHICWLGINPGSTTSKEAKALLRSSNQIDSKSLEGGDASISAVWFAGKLNTYPCNVSVQLENGLVKSITFDGLPFTMNNFIRLVREPDEISISLAISPDGPYIEYSTYYIAEKILINVSPGSRNGPDPNDQVNALFLNTEAKWKNIQSWLGYGHLKNYLPGVEIPAYTPMPTP